MMMEGDWRRKRWRLVHQLFDKDCHSQINLQLKIYFRSYLPGTKILSILSLVHIGIGFGKSDVDGASDGHLDVSMSAQPGYQFASAHLLGMLDAPLEIEAHRMRWLPSAQRQQHCEG
jgi:hypothetical protein